MEYVTVRVVKTGELFNHITRDNMVLLCETPVACLSNWATTWLLTNEGKLFSLYSKDGELLDPSRYSNEELEILNKFKTTKDEQK